MKRTLQNVILNCSSQRAFNNVSIKLFIETVKIAVDSNEIIAFNDRHIFADESTIFDMSGKSFVIGYPCFISATGELNIFEHVPVVGPINKLYHELDCRDINKVLR